MNQGSDEPFIKVIVVGEQGVGKTCLLNQYCYGRFDNSTPPTIGCDFTMKITKYQDKAVRLQLWDIAGQERYKSVSKLYVRGALGCLIVTDIMDQNSLAESTKWKSLVQEHCDQVDGQGIPMILIQNKVDEVKNMGKLESFQTEQYLQEFARENGFKSCYQTSAKDNINLNEVFDNMVKLVIDSGLLQGVKTQNNFTQSKQPTKQPGQSSQPVKLTNNNAQQDSQKKKKEGGCC